MSVKRDNARTEEAMRRKAQEHKPTTDVLCEACGQPVDRDLDLIGERGGGMHRRCT